jgi:dipeptidyl aminopeptidase/acylaminoacyl peptidase
MRNSLSSGLLLVVATLVLATPTRGQTTGLHSADLARLRSVDAVALSPDAARIAYTILYRDQPGRPYPQIWVMDIASGRTSRLAGEKIVNSDPVWSPNGEWIAYVADEGTDHHAELMIAHPDGSGSRSLAPVIGTNSPSKNEGNDVTWSPDGKKIAFVSATPGPETAAATGDPMVFTRYNYHTVGFGEGFSIFNDNRRRHIFVVDVGSRQVRQLTRENFDDHSIDWSPNGEEIVFASNREPDPDEFWNNDLFALRVSDDSIRRLTTTESGEYVPRWSPDGGSITFMGTKAGLNTMDSQNEDDHVWVMNADGTNRRELSTPDNRQGPPQWSPDGQAVYYPVVVRGNNWLYRSPAVGGQPEAVVNDLGRVVSWSVGKGGVLAYSFTGTQDLAELYLQVGGTTRQLTNLNAGVLAGREIAKVEPVDFLSIDYKYQVEGYLTKPASISPGSKHPLIVDIHGGPNYSNGPEFDFKPQVYASQGWATLTVNYRGSTGYGQKFAEAVFADQDNYDAQDILYAVSAAVRRNPWIDRDRMGIEGTSNGGFFTEWIISQTREFKAAIPTAPMTDLISYTYLTGIHYQQQEYGQYMHQGNLLDFIWERSPLRHVSSVATPTLLLSGANDPAATISQVEEYYVALKQVGVETEMVLYPREGHGLQETPHIIDDIDRSIAWYEKHFPPASAHVHTNVQP